jgi:hypothetical protein
VSTELQELLRSIDGTPSHANPIAVSPPTPKARICSQLLAAMDTEDRSILGCSPRGGGPGRASRTTGALWHMPGPSSRLIRSYLTHFDEFEREYDEFGSLYKTASIETVSFVTAWLRGYRVRT